jgi:hypothetical protein
LGTGVGSEEVGEIVGSDEGIDDVGLEEGSAVGCAVGRPLGAKVSCAHRARGATHSSGSVLERLLAQ